MTSRRDDDPASVIAELGHLVSDEQQRANRAEAENQALRSALSDLLDEVRPARGYTVAEVRRAVALLEGDDR